MPIDKRQEPRPFKSLYVNDGSYRYTTEALNLDNKASTALAPIFFEYASLGYSPREISHIVQSAVALLELERIP